MKKPLTIQKIMTKSPKTITKEKTVKQAAALMKKAKIGALPVIEKEYVVGVITERDILNKVIVKDLLPSKVIVEDVMSSNVVTISEGLPYYEALTTMNENKVKKIIVIGKNGKLTGILTLTDVLKLFSKMWADE